MLSLLPPPLFVPAGLWRVRLRGRRRPPADKIDA